MNVDPRDLEAMCNAIAAEWADKGKLIEGGWQAFVKCKGLQDVPDPVVREMLHKMFFLGAQHLFASILNILDADRDPTEKDLMRMDLIHKELRTFQLSLVN